VADLKGLQKKLGITFKSSSLLEIALVHSSYINENPGVFPSSNERLEFLGDAVLGLVIAQRLYHDLPEATEGELTRLRSALVRRDMLAQVARTIQLGEYLFLGVGEEGGGGRDKPANLAGSLEALIAAIYLDRGIEAARRLILKLFGSEMHQYAHSGAGTDYKSRLQEVLQADQQITPAYYLLSAVGPDHAKIFTVEVRAGGTVLGRGMGNSKKVAEMEAARVALESREK
jgi:ribonuclease III